jgi:hypothetical protein
VRCIVGGVLADGAVARGTLTVARDAGKRRLPRKVPDNTVEADGRPYRVVYQNLLPHVTFVWRTDLPSGPFRLFVEGEQGARYSIGGDKPMLTMASGELAEGRYRFWFEHADARSEVSTLAIEFDNASPRAYVEDLEPAGGGLRVSGAALAGWRVFVADTPAPLDRENRFTLEVPRPADAAGIAVKLVSPTGDVHTYVRRAP